MDPEDAYVRMLQAWNDQDAAGFGAVLTDPCSCVGFDGTEYTSPAEAEEALSTIFADHQVAQYVWLIRSTRALAEGVVLVRAVAGMVSPDHGGLIPDRHVVQNVVAIQTPIGWQIASYQNTPARYDGRPEAVQALTAELGEVLSRRTSPDSGVSFGGC